MNHNNNEHDDGRAIDEREWLAQERAMRESRAGAASTDPMALRYRKVADALREPLPDLLPPDFAAQVARQAEANAAAPVRVPEPLADAGFEFNLMRGLIGLLGLGSAVVAAMYGREWLAPTLDLLHLESGVAVNWALAAAACVGVSWLTEQVRRHRESAPHAA
jgi:hypothetical protein